MDQGGAREQVESLPTKSDQGVNWPRKGHEPGSGLPEADPGVPEEGPETALPWEKEGVARVGIEPTTPRFSVVCSTN